MNSQITESRLKKSFNKFHTENLHVYELLKKFTFEVINRGYQHYGIAALFERIRWHTNIETKGLDFKLGNNHRAFYARKFHQDFPEHSGFFRTRIQRGEEN